MRREKIKLEAADRLLHALWGALLVTLGLAVIALYSGYTLDYELIAILTLAVIGVWLLTSALVLGINNRRNKRILTTPTDSVSEMSSRLG